MQVKCPSCKAVLNYDQEYFGKKFKCANCLAVVEIGKEGIPRLVAPNPASAPASKPVPTGGRLVKYRCKHCKAVLETDASLGGHGESCPLCHKVNEVPVTRQERNWRKEREEALRQQMKRQQQDEKAQARAEANRLRKEQKDQKPAVPSLASRLGGSFRSALGSLKQGAKAIKLRHDLDGLHAAVEGQYETLGKQMLSQPPADLDLTGAQAELSRIQSDIAGQQAALEALRRTKGSGPAAKQAEGDIRVLRQQQRQLAVDVGRAAEAGKVDAPGALAIYSALDRLRSVIAVREADLAGIEGPRAEGVPNRVPVRQAKGLFTDEPPVGADKQASPTLPPQPTAPLAAGETVPIPSPMSVPPPANGLPRDSRSLGRNRLILLASVSGGALLLIAGILIFASSRGRSAIPSIPEKTSSFHKIVFTDPKYDTNTITMISETECEVRSGRHITLGEYSRQGNKLRVVIKVFGGSSIWYYDIVQEGLRSSDGDTYLLPGPLRQYRERVRLAKEAEEKRQREEQERQRVEAERRVRIERERQQAIAAAKQREEEEQRRKAEEAYLKIVPATVPGTAYVGTISCNRYDIVFNTVSGTDIQRIRLVFTKQDGRSLRADMTNLDQPQRKQTFSGKVVLDAKPEDGGKGPYYIQMKAIGDSFGSDNRDWKTWWSPQPDREMALFFADKESTIRLCLTKGGMDGKGKADTSGYQMSVRLTREKP